MNLKKMAGWLFVLMAFGMLVLEGAFGDVRQVKASDYKLGVHPNATTIRPTNTFGRIMYLSFIPTALVGVCLIIASNRRS